MLARVFICAVGVMMAFGQVTPAVSRPIVQLIMLPDGGFQIEGHRYGTQATLAAEIRLLNKRHPRPAFDVLIVDRRTPYGVVMPAMASLQSIDGVKIGVVNFAPK
jgi:biopolymer transport protein ExbD